MIGPVVPNLKSIKQLPIPPELVAEDKSGKNNLTGKMYEVNPEQGDTFNMVITKAKSQNGEQRKYANKVDKLPDGRWAVGPDTFALDRMRNFFYREEESPTKSALHYISDLNGEVVNIPSKPQRGVVEELQVLTSEHKDDVELLDRGGFKYKAARKLLQADQFNNTGQGALEKLTNLAKRLTKP